jgi:hypothetical protein
MTTGAIFLVILWVSSHLLIGCALWENKSRVLILVLISVLLLVTYAKKPYTYDLNKYSIYFNSGFIETRGWRSTADGIELSQSDIASEPFAEGWEAGFRVLARVGHLTLPTGGLISRVEVDINDAETQVPQSDAMVFLIMLLGFVCLYFGAKTFLNGSLNLTKVGSFGFLSSAPLILGSVFFILGSQNTLRQFLSLSIVVLAMSMCSSRRYVICFLLIVLSALFHKWGPILGLFGVMLIVLGKITEIIPFIQKRKIFSLYANEILSFFLGISVVILIKGIAVLGLFNSDLPFLPDLKPFLILQDQFQAAERLSASVKLSAIIIIFLISEVVLGRCPRHPEGVNIRSLRRRMFFFVCPLVVYPEIFSRVVVFYWAIETVFLVWAFSSDRFRTRLSAGIVFCSYGFAPNAINVLIGPSWFYSL